MYMHYLQLVEMAEERGDDLGSAGMEQLLEVVRREGLGHEQ